MDDFKKVIDNKINDWKNNNDMQKYLRPETLFGNKFESYLNQKNRNPDWFYEDLKTEEPTENEKKQLEEELNNLIEDIQNIN